MDILCVCLGNICRSPMAEGALRRRAEAAGLDLTVDSAGTGAWHVGHPPDPRGLRVASARGYDNGSQRARAVGRTDFARFDLIVAMDRSNLENLRRLSPPSARAEVRLFHPDGIDIPDPFYGADRDYEHALDLIEEAADALISEIAARA